MAETRQPEVDLLLLFSRSLKFANNHPFAAMGILGAAAGSAVTYSIMAAQMDSKDAQALRGKVYEIPIAEEDLENLLDNPTHVRLRYEFPLVTVVVTKEEKQRPLELPDIIVDP